MADTIGERILQMLQVTASQLLNLFENVADVNIPDRIKSNRQKRLKKIGNPQLLLLKGNIAELDTFIQEIFIELLEEIRVFLPQDRIWQENDESNYESTKDTFNRTVTGMLKILEASLNRDKANLLSDIYTEVADTLKSELMNEHLWPLYKYMSNEALNIMECRLLSNLSSSDSTYKIENQPDYIRREVRNLDHIYRRTATRLDISIEYVIKCLKDKRNRNRATHYDKIIKQFNRDNFGSNQTRPEFRIFAQSRNLQIVFSPNEMEIAEKIYPAHCNTIVTDYYKRLIPGEHIWLRNSITRLWNVAVYVESAGIDRHRVWPYTHNGRPTERSRESLGKMGDDIDPDVPSLFRNNSNEESTDNQLQSTGH